MKRVTTGASPCQSQSLQPDLLPAVREHSVGVLLDMHLHTDCIILVLVLLPATLLVVQGMLDIGDVRGSQAEVAGDGVP